MNISFDKSAKQRVWQLINSKLNDKRCAFCGVTITAKNFAGAAYIDGQFRAFNRDISCLIQLSDALQKEQS